MTVFIFLPIHINQILGALQHDFRRGNPCDPATAVTTARVIPVEDKTTSCSTPSPRICFAIEFASYDRCGDILATRSKGKSYVGNLL